jgi:drug/metabolite transporter (DMT)-like permease
VAQESRPLLRAYLTLGAGVVALGFSGIFVSWAAAPGPVTGFYRMVVAILLLAPAYIARRHRHGRVPRHELRIALLAGLFFGCDLVFWNSGILLSGATNPTLMGNTAPLWVGIGAKLLLRERLNRTFWIGLSVAMAGAALILGLDISNAVGLGTFLGLLAGIFYGAYYLVIQRSRIRLDALSTFWLSGLSAAVVLLLLAVAMGQPLVGYSTTTYINFLALGLVVQVGGQMAIGYALGYLPASTVSPTVLLQAVVTALLAIPLLGETFSLLQIIGGLTVIAGVFAVHRGRATSKTTMDS